MSLQEKLHDLFVLDRQVRGMQGRMDSATARLTSQQSKLDSYHQQHQELLTQLKLSQSKASDLENQVAGIEERIGHLRDQMQNVTSNKEYSAVLIEVNTLKVDKDKLETEALEHLNQVDMFKQESQALLERSEGQEKLLDQAAGDVEACRSEIGERLDELNTQRAQAEQEIPLEVRSLFNRMAEMHEGEAMAPVTEVSRRNLEYNCGGCYISIPIERVNTLMTQQDEVVCCPSCNRILYLDQELKTSISCK